LRGQGSNNGLIAMQFDSYITDKLEGVDLYFTQLYDSLNLGYFFKLMVWGDDNGKPGEVLYESEIDSTVNYSDEINKYIRFPFERTVTVSNKFYVGMMQYNQYMLNIGLDINNKTNGHLFYNLGEGWEISGAPGILMMRPYVKKPLTKVEENIFPGTELQVWPNPADTHLFLKAGDISLDGSTVSIYDLTGKILYRDRYTGEEISTGMLNEGIYILRLDNGQSNPLTVKFLVRR